MGAEISKSITKYAVLYDMTQDDVHKFLASRDSLETIAGLLGLMPWYGGKKEAEGVINALSAYLTERGYEPPQKWCHLDQYVTDIERKKDEETETRETQMVETYTRMREEGFSMAKIARAIGIHPKTLYRKREQWGIDW